MAEVSVQEKLSTGRILRDGSILSILFALFVYGSFAIEMEMWVHDYPPDIREKWGEKSERAIRLPKLLAIPFLQMFFGGILLSNLGLSFMLATGALSTYNQGTTSRREYNGNHP